MKAIILTAGMGTRMQPLTSRRPKSMLPVLNKPILEHTIFAASRAGIQDFVFVVGYQGESVRSYFGDGAKWGVNIEYCEQSQQLGTAHAVQAARHFVNGESFLVANGDIITGPDDIRQILQNGGITIGVSRVADTTGLGVLETTGNRVVRILEKTDRPPTNMANTGTYLFTPEIEGALLRTMPSARGEYEITDSLQLLINDGVPVYCQEFASWIDLSYPWDLLKANELLLGRSKPEVLGDIEPNVTLKGHVSVGRGTVVHSGSYIVGPVAIGENCEIGPNCYIRPGTTVGNDCHIGAACEVKNSVIMRGSKVPHLNYVGDSIIGEDCNLGAGTKIANLRLDHKNIRVEGHDTKRRKFGAIIGDRVQTGINVSINVGSVIGNNNFIRPGTVVNGRIPSAQTPGEQAPLSGKQSPVLSGN